MHSAWYILQVYYFTV